MESYKSPPTAKKKGETNCKRFRREQVCAVGGVGCSLGVCWLKGGKLAIGQAWLLFSYWIGDNVLGWVICEDLSGSGGIPSISKLNQCLLHCDLPSHIIFKCQLMV